MRSLPPFVAKLIAPDGYQDTKYFETEAAAIRWVLGEGKEKFDGDIQRAEICHPKNGLVWFRDHLKVEADVRYRQMQSDPDSLLRHYGIPKPKPAPDIEAYCNTCQRETMNWREYEEWCGIPLGHKPLPKCSECYKVVPDSAARS
jgi:hypothetical protein